jgi:chemotaxis protein MotB
MNTKVLIYFLLVVVFYSSCVSMKKYNDLQAKQQQSEAENTSLKTANDSLNTSVHVQIAIIEDLNQKIDGLQKDTTSLGNSLRKEKELYASLNKTYNDLVDNYEKLAKNKTAENKKLIGQLQSTQEDLQIKEDKLNSIQVELAKKAVDLDKAKADLYQREQRLKELQDILSKKDSTVRALRNAVADALLGFKDKGMTVTLRNGKVYVSLEEQLLFGTGSAVVDKKGVDALKQLATVLEKNSDINILIEGHTDNVPLKGEGYMKDNWDLSVNRATSVVRILTSNSKINPKRLTAAGRSEYVPIEEGNSKEARQKNRRIEIILTPKLDELFKVIESN